MPPSEADLSDPDSFDWAEVTQEIAGQPRCDWQAPWDERPLDESNTRWAFFFHDLDLTRPLLTQDGAIELPEESALPEHLLHVEYESP